MIVLDFGAEMFLWGAVTGFAAAIGVAHAVRLYRRRKESSDA